MSKKNKYSGLVANGIISSEDLNSAISRASLENIDIENIFLDELKLSRKDIGKSLEDFYNIPYQMYDGSNLPGSLFAGLNKDFLRRYKWVPLTNEKDTAIILIDDPSDENKINNIPNKFSKKKIELRVGLKSDIHDFLDSTSNGNKDADQGFDNDVEFSIGALISALKSEEFHSAADLDEVTKLHEASSTIVKLVDKVFIDAQQQNVSDIHFEPGLGKKKMTIRFRKDGICKIYQTIPYLYKFAIISRIKIMAKLNIAEKRLPQDGKILMKHKQGQIECRVATLPTVGGNEDAVIRILADSKPIAITKMNFSKRDLNLIQEKVKKPYGLILAVGPTGSGKTTTLHSCLGSINAPEKKIWTAEDPVEITQEGLRQVQILEKIGLNFARALRSFLRGDPDVIMVGEMRDAETCSISLEASLTGHLVFSTLHTNSAPETITRLVDMGMNPLHFADALLLVIAQRLVHTLCKKCKEDYHPTKEEFDILVEQYGADEFSSLGIEYKDSLMLKRPVGCKNCEETGLAGRTGIYEILEGTSELKNLIMKGATVEVLRKQAISDGMTTLKQDGIKKVFKGECDLKHVNAVCLL